MWASIVFEVWKSKVQLLGGIQTSAQNGLTSAQNGLSFRETDLDAIAERIHRRQVCQCAPWAACERVGEEVTACTGLNKYRRQALTEFSITSPINLDPHRHLTTWADPKEEALEACYNSNANSCSIGEVTCPTRSLSRTASGGQTPVVYLYRMAPIKPPMASVFWYERYLRLVWG